MNRIAITAHATGDAPPQAAPHADNVSVGLWLLMGVLGVLFTLFGLAYVMRMAQGDAFALALPWQLALSSTLLAAASLAMHAARSAAHRSQPEPAQRWLLAGAGCAVAFLAAQFWAWQALAAAAVLPAGNPAASFFYLLSALHALHVAGGLVAWDSSWRALVRATQATHATQETPEARAHAAAWRVALCARYWHFLLLVWLGLLGLLGGVSPELARTLCGVA